jgi:hypothetical protein
MEVNCISSLTCRPACARRSPRLLCVFVRERAARGRVHAGARTDGDWVVDVLGLDDVTQEHRRFFLALYTLIVVEYNAWRIDDT